MKKLIIIFILILIIIIFSVIFALININNDRFINGVTVDGIDLSGLKMEEAREKLEQKANTTNKIEIYYKDFSNELDGKQINVNHNIDLVLEEAYKIGRSGNILKNNYQILCAMIFGLDVSSKLELDEERLNNEVDSISQRIPGVMVESNYYIESDKLIISKGKPGIVVNKEELISKIRNSYESYNNSKIEIPVIQAQPEEMSMQKIYDEIYKKPQNAYIEKEPFKVYPEVNGIDLAISIEEANKILNEDKEEYIIPLKITKPEITTNNLGEDAFPDLLGRYTTRYDPGTKDRNTNLELAANKINGAIILPGEIFSYNRIVGQRTIDAGYKEASTYARR